LFFLILLIAVISCKDEVKNTVKRSTNPEKTPTVVTHDITTLISDSGVTKYRITSKVWYIYEESKTPRWTFPKGLYLEQFDSVFKTEATFRCDTAVYFKDRGLWRFDGNVRIWNARKELILTNQMYWDQNMHKVYSDSFIHIERLDRVLEGYGFTSNERITTYTIRKPMGIFPVQENRTSTRRDPGSRSVINK